MKPSFTHDLAVHLFLETLKNSYYNDECDVNCYTPDFDSAYEYIKAQKEINVSSLSDTYKFKNEDNENQNEEEEKYSETEYTGLDLLKLAVRGDFENENNIQSSELANLVMCADLIEKTKGDKNIWEHKKNTEFVKRVGYSEHDYRKHLCDNYNLTSLVGARALSVGSKSGTEALTIAVKIGKKLQGYRGFEPETDSQSLGSTSTATLPSGVSEANLKKVATYVKNKTYSKLSETQNYELRKAAITHVIYGKSGNLQFDKAVDEIKGIQEIIASRGNPLEI